MKFMSALAVTFLVATSAAPAAATPTRITLLHINDSHSHLAPFGPKNIFLDGTIGGIAKVATVITSERAKNPSALFVHSGDVFHGDFFMTQYFGVPELRILDALGLDAMVLGNHE